MPTRIREMDEADLARVAELSSQLGYPVEVCALLDHFSRIFPDRDHALFVAIDPGGAVIGWTHVHARWLLESEPHAELAALVVDEKVRRSGAGRALVSHAENWARAQGFGSLRVRSNVVRPEAHAFYPALGFERVKTQHTYRKKLG